MTQLNKDESELLVKGSKKENLDTEFILSQQTWNFGVIIDLELNFKAQVGYVSWSALIDLKNAATVRSFLSPSNTERLIDAFTSNRLDYCHALLSNLPESVINNQQIVIFIVILQIC